MNYLYHYKKYFYEQINIPVTKVKIGGFYRLFNYRYTDTNKARVYSSNETPILLILGKNPQKKLLHCIKFNKLPVKRFIKLLKEIQNPQYTKELLIEIEDTQKVFQTEVRYQTNRKAIIIDKTGRAFYKNVVKRKRDLEVYDTYRTYFIPNINQIKELYLDVSKLKDKLGFKDFDINEENI